MLISYKAYNYVIQNMKKADILSLLFCCSGIVNLSCFMWSRELEITEFKENNEYFGKNKEEILTELRRPTVYISNDGLITLPYDSDFNCSTLRNFINEPEVDSFEASWSTLASEAYEIYKSSL